MSEFTELRQQYKVLEKQVRNERRQREALEAEMAARETAKATTVLRDSLVALGATGSTADPELFLASRSDKSVPVTAGELSAWVKERS